MNLSFAIPFYNKSIYIEKTLLSIAETCGKSSISWEIVITDNCSEPEESKELIATIERIGCKSHTSVYALSATISLHENWLYAVSMCTGDIINLRLADDPLLPFDVDYLASCFSDSSVDYVSTNSLPAFEAGHKVNEKDVREGFEITKRFKKEYIKNPIKSYHRLFNGDNPFGDINPLFFRHKCISLLREPLRLLSPAFASWPDLEIWLKITLYFKGLHLDIDTSQFTYNKSSSSTLAETDDSFRSLAYDNPSEISRLLIYHPAYKEACYNKLSEHQKLIKTSSIIEFLISISEVNPKKIFFKFLADFLKYQLLRLRKRVLGSSTKNFLPLNMVS
jgi:glycosyltransferase involved in cell wall biosynthesis